MSGMCGLACCWARFIGPNVAVTHEKTRPIAQAGIGVSGEELRGVPRRCELVTTSRDGDSAKDTAFAIMSCCLLLRE